MAVLYDHGITALTPSEIADILVEDVTIATSPKEVYNCLNVASPQYKGAYIKTGITGKKGLHYKIMAKGIDFVLNGKNREAPGIPYPIDKNEIRPDFSIITNDKRYCDVLEKRWDEAIICKKSGAHLSAIILLGSILEGILFTIAKDNPGDAMKSSSAPKRKDGSVKGIDEWKLTELITVAKDVGWIQEDASDFGDQVREFRNLVHPKEQAKKRDDPDDDTVNISLPIIRAAINDLITFKNKKSPAIGNGYEKIMTSN